MKYMGSKNRIAKHILPIMLKERIGLWIEPFVGGANTIDKVGVHRIGLDINPHTIQALIAIRDFPYDLPETVTEEEYQSLKGTEPNPITSWVRFVCSFGGKFENGYARGMNAEGKNRNYALESKRNAVRQSKGLQGVVLKQANYDSFFVEKALIFCDPPYKGTTAYKTESFDHDKFWQWCRDMSKHNTVFISEYNAPDDFDCVWQGELKTNLASQATTKSTEKLFRIKT